MWLIYATHGDEGNFFPIMLSRAGHVWCSKSMTELRWVRWFLPYITLFETPKHKIEDTNFDFET